MNYSNIVYVLIAFSFYLVPAIAGSVLTDIYSFIKTSLLKKPAHGGLNLNNSLIDAAVAFFRNFALGGILLYTLNVLAASTNAGDRAKFYSAFLVAILFLFTIFICIKLFKNVLFPKFTLSQLLFIGLSITLSISIYTIWRWDSPESATLNWDIYHQQLAADIITSGKFSTVPSKLSDTFQFDAYTTFFHFTLSTPKTLFGFSNNLTFWYYLEFFHLLTTVFASFLIAFMLTKNRFIALITMLICALTFEILEAYSILFLLPQTLTGTFSAVLIAHRLSQKGFTLKFNDLIIIIFCSLGHFLIGGIAILTFFVGSVFKFIQAKLNKRFLLGFVLVTFLALLTIIITSYRIDLSSINRGEAKYYTYDLSKKFDISKDFYGYAFFLLVPLGFIYLFKEKKHDNLALLGFLTIIIVGILVAHFPYDLKTIVLERYFLYTTMACGFWLVIERTSTAVKYALITILGLVLGINLILSFTKYKFVPDYKEIASHLNPNDLLAIDYLKKTYNPKDGILVLSDPATMHMVEMLTGLNTPGGGYALTPTRKVLSHIFFVRDRSILIPELFSIRDGLDHTIPNKILLAVGGRYERWVLNGEENMMSVHWDVWTPHDLTVSDYEKDGFIDYLLNTAKLKEVFRNSGIIIFEVEYQDIFQ